MLRLWVLEFQLTNMTGIRFELSEVTESPQAKLYIFLMYDGIEPDKHWKRAPTSNKAQHKFWQDLGGQA